MYRTPFYLFLCLIFISNCQQKHSSDTVENNAKQFKNIVPSKKEGNRLQVSDSLGIANKIELVRKTGTSDVFAVISDITNIPPLHLVNLTDDKYLTGIGREGRGPGEFLAPGSIYAFEKDSVLVLDNENIRLTKINLTNENHLENIKDAKPKTINLEFEGLPLEVFPIEKDRYVAVGPIRTGGKENIAILDSTGSETKLVGEIPNFDTDVPPSVHQLAWRSAATSRGDGQRFAVGFYNVDMLKIYDNEGNIMEITRGPRQDKLSYSTKNKRLSLNENTVRAYIDLASTKKKIYALYSGKNINKGKNNFGQYIFVFDWEGDFIKSFKLDHFVFSITVDESNGILYGIVPESLEPGIYKYKLN